MRGLIGVRVGNQIGQEQADGYPAAQAVGQVLRFTGRDDVVVCAMQSECRRSYAAGLFKRSEGLDLRRVVGSAPTRSLE